MMPAHSLGALGHPKIARTACAWTAALFHLRRTHVHSRSSALRTELRTLPPAARIHRRSLATFALHWCRQLISTARITLRACLLTRRTILPGRAVFVSLIGSTIGAVHLPVIAAKAAFARFAIAVLRTGFVVAWSFGTFGVGTTGDILPLRRLGSVFLGAERPRGKRECGCGDEYRVLFHVVVLVHRENAATRRFCAGRFVNEFGRS